MPVQFIRSLVGSLWVRNCIVLVIDTTVASWLVYLLTIFSLSHEENAQACRELPLDFTALTVVSATSICNSNTRTVDIIMYSLLGIAPRMLYFAVI